MMTAIIMIINVTIMMVIMMLIMMINDHQDPHGGHDIGDQHD